MPEASEVFDGPSNVVGVATARKIGDEGVETLEDGAGDGEAANMFEGFVEDVAGVEVGDDEDVGVASDW